MTPKETHGSGGVCVWQPLLPHHLGSLEILWVPVPFSCDPGIVLVVISSSQGRAAPQQGVMTRWVWNSSWCFTFQLHLQRDMLHMWFSFPKYCIKNIHNSGDIVLLKNIYKPFRIQKNSCWMKPKAKSTPAFCFPQWPAGSPQTRENHVSSLHFLLLYLEEADMTGSYG